MAHIKWRRGKPYIYTSARKRESHIAKEHGTYVAKLDTEKIVSKYHGSYQAYREKRPCGDYTRLLTSKAQLTLIAKHPERLELLRSIDADVHRRFERGEL